tara:strand:+ start:17893 stop:18411 length:519 start_codon:yes stop_codon:yes gene_type:complete
MADSYLRLCILLCVLGQFGCTTISSVNKDQHVLSSEENFLGYATYTARDMDIPGFHIQTRRRARFELDEIGVFFPATYRPSNSFELASFDSVIAEIHTESGGIVLLDLAPQMSEDHGFLYLTASPEDVANLYIHIFYSWFTYDHGADYKVTIYRFDELTVQDTVNYDIPVYQ